MAHISVEHGTVGVILTTVENAEGVHRDFSFPVTSIVDVIFQSDPIELVHGLRSPGTGLLNHKIGTWRSGGSKSFASVTRDAPGLIISLSGEAFDQVILSLDNAAELRSTLVLAGAQVSSP